jgi:transcription initiation factor TFIID subunit TAF12
MPENDALFTVDCVCQGQSHLCKLYVQWLKRRATKGWCPLSAACVDVESRVQRVKQQQQQQQQQQSQEQQSSARDQRLLETQPLMPDSG